MKVYFKAWLTVLVLVLALGVLVMIILATQLARAAGPWYVAPGGSDSNACTSPSTACATINGAIAKASSDDTIYVAVGTYTGTGAWVVVVDKSATLSGGWNSAFTAQSGTSTIDGEGARRGMTVNSGVTAVVERLTIQNGSASYLDGGGIHNSGTMTLNNSTISENTAREGGGIHNLGTMALNNSTVSENTAGMGGSGIFNAGTLTLNNSTVSGNTADTGGGGISNWGIVTLNNSTVSGNTAGTSGGGIWNPGTLTLNKSTISGNIGAGIDNYTGSAILTLNNSSVSGNIGNGIYNSGTANLNNSTVSGNTARNGGGIHNLWIGTLTLNNSTVSNNTANEHGGGIANDDGTVTLQNTIVAGNTTGGISPDCSGSIGSVGYNLVGDTSGCTLTPGPGDLLDVDPRLFPLVGLPGYHPLLPGSPAINAGNPTGCTDHLGNPLTTDQRGFPRLGRCDIGAYEVFPLEFSTKSVNKSAALPGDSLTYTIALNNVETVNITDVRVADTLPISLTYISNSLTATSGSYGYTNRVITWTGSVNTGGAVTITFGATVSQTVSSGISITNSAVISGGGETITRTATVAVEQRLYLPVVLKNW